MFMLVPEFGVSSAMFKLHTYKNSSAGNPSADFYSKRYILLLDNQTKSLKKYFQHLVFEGFDARWSDSFEEAFDYILNENIRVVISHVNLIDSDITRFSQRLKEISYSGTLVPVLTDPLAHRAIQALGFDYRYHLDDLDDFKHNDLLISILRDKESKHAIDTLPYVEWTERFELSIPSMPQLIERVIEYFIDKAGKLEGIDRHLPAIRIAISEALANAIEHGNCFDINKNVKISFILSSEKLIMTIRDEGKGFSPNAIQDISETNKAHGIRGRGIYIIKKSMDVVRFNSRGNVIKMIKKLAPAKPGTSSEKVR